MSALDEHVHAVLGDPRRWRDPTGYPDGLALCVLDSIWSLGLHYDRHVVPVLQRYRAFRRTSGADPDRDGLRDLRSVFGELGGASAFAERAGTAHVTSTHRGAPLKASAALAAADALIAVGVDTTADFLDVGRQEGAHQAWRTVPGQRSSDTGWRYLLLLAGADEVKPDRMILRFVSTATGRPVGTEEAATLVQQTAVSLAVPVRVLDHAIWRYQRTRPRKS